MASSCGVTWDQVVEMASMYPAVVTKSSYGTPGIYVGKKFMARLREPDVMVLTPVYEDEQRFLMETSPETFFLTDHYRGYPTILIRLSNAQRAQLAKLVEESWRRLAGKKLLAEFEARSSGGGRPSPVPPPKRKASSKK